MALLEVIEGSNIPRAMWTSRREDLPLTTPVATTVLNALRESRGDFGPALVLELQRMFEPAECNVPRTPRV